MRIWSLHPEYLDPRGLVALWREGLLAQAVLLGKTRGYLHHPQLDRFKKQSDPVGCIAEYLRVVHQEATRRGYCFAGEKINAARTSGHLTVPLGQLGFEWHHLLNKVKNRDPQWMSRLTEVKMPRPHPLFREVPGGVAAWEKQTASPEVPGKGGNPMGKHQEAIKMAIRDELLGRFRSMNAKAGDKLPVGWLYDDFMASLSDKELKALEEAISEMIREGLIEHVAGAKPTYALSQKGTDILC